MSPRRGDPSEMFAEALSYGASLANRPAFSPHQIHAALMTHPLILQSQADAGLPHAERLAWRIVERAIERLLAERRVGMTRVLPTSVLAYVRDDSGELRTVTWDPRRGFRCDCPAVGFCAHGHAVASVVVVASGATIDGAAIEPLRSSRSGAA